jgi:hypothetical protein
MNLDIQTTVRTIFIFLLIACLFVILTAVRAFREAGRLRFFLKKRELLGRAWKYVLFAVLIGGFAILINTFAEPLTYSVFPPSPTVTQTPTITLTATVTLTPTATITPTMTQTPEFTSTPIMPAVISQDFTSKVTPNPEAIFSNLAFSRRVDEEYQPINPASSFENPIDIIYGSFSYDRMITNSQWSALWFRDGELIFYETKPWNGASGGFGYTDCRLPADKWLSGAYEVQIFVGETWKASGRFTVTGIPPTPTITSTPTITKTPTITFTVTNTITPTRTVTPTGTLIPTSTLSPSLTMTITPSLTLTLAPSSTPSLVPTQMPSGTPTKTLTPTPNKTSTATLSPSPTLVPTATRFSTIYR